MAQKVVTVHRGARDGYHVALALQEAGLLDTLVTDLYWPSGGVASTVENFAPRGVTTQLKARSRAGLPWSSVKCCWFSGLASLALERMRSAPFALRRDATRWCDATLGATAGRLANRNSAALLSYSYYGFDAFSHLGDIPVPRILFQLHPHPVTVRRILSEELRLHPECSSSLAKEWELSLPQADLQRLIEEPLMAGDWIAASSFTRATLIENGIPAGRIHVVPYGTDLDRFRPAAVRRGSNGPVQLLFVGSICQRKGISYLLDAFSQLPEGSAQLTICGRVVDDLALFQHNGPAIQVRPNVSDAELLAAYQAADLFVFPSLAEGFGHVLLEAMACGLPVLSTTRTAAPDIVDEQCDGFVVEPGDTGALYQRLQWCVDNRDALREMRDAARQKAEQFSWHRFRDRLQSTVQGMLSARCLEAEPC
ncbi:MAG: glycosyltransferase family 4 protein [Bryobacterales bacterium]|nr:glycosyltransferase family 4 protein [Bryobacterales bacterium]